MTMPKIIITRYPTRSEIGPKKTPSTVVAQLTAIKDVMAVNGTPSPRLNAGANGYAKRLAVLRTRRQATTKPIFRINWDLDSDKFFVFSLEDILSWNVDRYDFEMAESAKEWNLCQVVYFRWRANYQ
jgi:hypothetical protein